MLNDITMTLYGADIEEAEGYLKKHTGNEIKRHMNNTNQNLTKKTRKT